MSFSFFTTWHNSAPYLNVSIISFLNSRENLKVGTVLSGTGIVASVLGFLPVLGFLCFNLKVPNPRISIWFPSFKQSFVVLKKLSTITLTSFLIITVSLTMIFACYCIESTAILYNNI